MAETSWLVVLLFKKRSSPLYESKGTGRNEWAYVGVLVFVWYVVLVVGGVFK